MLRFKNKEYSAVSPVNHERNIRINSEKHTIHVSHANRMQVRVYTLDGRHVNQKTGNGSLTFEMQHDGIYLVHVHLSDGNTHVEKVIVTK